MATTESNWFAFQAQSVRLPFNSNLRAIRPRIEHPPP